MQAGIGGLGCRESGDLRRLLPKQTIGDSLNALPKQLGTDPLKVANLFSRPAMDQQQFGGPTEGRRQRSDCRVETRRIVIRGTGGRRRLVNG